MTLANDAIAITPGSGATVATFSPGGSNTTEYQVTMLANATGNIVDSMPTYGLSIPYLPTAANGYHWELFNHPSSGKTLTVRGVWAIPQLDTALATGVYPRYEMYRTTAVGSGGTASAAFESATTILANFFRMDTGDASLSSHVSCRTKLTSITTGTALWSQHVPSIISVGGTGAAYPAGSDAAIFQTLNLIPQREFGEELVVRVGTGLATRQGTVAATGNVAWLIQFTVDP